VPAYRCYFLDDRLHIKAVEFIEAEGAEVAIAVGQRFLIQRPQHHAIEIWDKGRKLYPTDDLKRA
jgi:hypothetical protein